MAPPTDGPLYLVAVIKPRPDAADRVEARLRVMVAGTLAEPGCERMELVVSPDDPHTWIMLEKFHSRRDWDDHMQTDHVTQGNAFLDGLLREPTELRFYTEK
jgi:quinol monooxygenase YgiN